MATKLRLQRHGKKGKPFFHVIAADSRSPRDGKYIERIGKYDPTTVPATIELNFDKALDWVKKGAEPTNTVRAILAYKGVLYKNHLDRGVIKGALTQDVANAKFEKWLKEKEAKISGHMESVVKKNEEKKRAALKFESERNAERAAKIAAKSKPAEEKAESPAVENTSEETPTAE